MELIELQFLQTFYYLISILLAISLGISCLVYLGKQERFIIPKYFVLFGFAFTVAFLFGFRDIKVGTDTNTYKYVFDYVFRVMDNLTLRKDPLWDSFNFILSRFTSDVYVLFVIVAFLYVFLPIFGAKKYLGENTIYFFLLFLISPNFFLYGANGIRNGLAASFFIFALPYHNMRKQYIWIIISVFVHASMALPALIYLFISKKITNLNFLYGIWFLLLLTAVVNINIWSFIPFDIERLDRYLDSSEGESQATKIVNIPVNFLIYSIAPLVLSFYLLVVQKVKDEFYYRLVVTYLLCSCVYIISFNLKFASRFAYLSEFLMPFLLIYPCFKFKLFRFLEIKIVLILLVVFMIKAYKILSIA